MLYNGVFAGVMGGGDRGSGGWNDGLAGIATTSCCLKRLRAARGLTKPSDRSGCGAGRDVWEGFVVEAGLIALIDATEEEVGCGAGFPSLGLRCRLAERARSFSRAEALGLTSAVTGEG